MSRPTPRAYAKIIAGYKAQLDKAMQNNDTKKINSTMKKLQGLNATKATKIRSPIVDPSKVEKKAETPKASPMPRRRRRPTADPRPTPKGGDPRTRGQAKVLRGTLMPKKDTPRRRRRPTADPRPTIAEPRPRERAKGIDRPQKRRTTVNPRLIPMPTKLPRRKRRGPIAERRPAKVVDATATGDRREALMRARARQRQKLAGTAAGAKQGSRREALARARARQRAKVLRGVPKVGDPRTRGQMSNFLKELRQMSPTMKRAHKAAQKKARQQTAKRDQRSVRGGKLMEENRKKLMKLTGGRSPMSVALGNLRKKKT